ncbi:(R)-mandelonitrile lyase [Methylomarinum vadi]|uniref:(R)-mandelonitrile lyase n=1 Tax=Methylomarinum vadi TaxID=438855 RepID=UPI0009FCEA5E|nr:carboxymuconolactone decarboxylase family protein [Methylomarinum vadi]
MPTKKRFFSTMMLALTGCVTKFGLAAKAKPAGQTLYQAGSQKSFKGPEAYFTGEVRVDIIFPGNETAHYSGAYVTFQPGARTAWHLHPAGQHMVVTSGVALTGTRDGKVIEFNVGDAVWCPPNIDHWHGATPDEQMTHLVITGSLDDQNVVWKEKVSDAQYYASRQTKEKSSINVDALTAKQQSIVPIAAFTASGDLERLNKAIKAGLNAGLSVNEIKEIQIHLYAYAGFPRALNGLATLMTVLDERKAEGIQDEAGKSASSLLTDKSSTELGKEVQTRLVGRPVSGPLFDFAPDINRLLQSHLFGDLFTRGILDDQSREIATLSALASIDGVDSQLKAHVGIASNVGLTQNELTALVTVLKETVGKQEGGRAEQALMAVLSNRSKNP